LGLKTKLSTSRLLGIPFTVVVGNNYTARQLEVYDLHSEDSNGITTKDLVKLATPLAAAEQVVKALEHEDVIPLMSS
jgi:prephenate dehydrogenase